MLPLDRADVEVVLAYVALLPNLLVSAHPDYVLITNRQDWAACESVQRGLASGAYVPGPIAPREDAVHGVVQWFARKYLDDEESGR